MPFCSLSQTPADATLRVTYVTEEAVNTALICYCKSLESLSSFKQSIMVFLSVRNHARNFFFTQKFLLPQIHAILTGKKIPY